MNEKNSNSSNAKHPNPALFERFLNVQEQELVLRGQEIDLRKLNDTNTHEYAKAALSANVKDREAERSYMKNVMKDRFIFAGIVIFFLVLLFCFALYFDKDAIVMEIVKAIMFFGAGGIGGYAYARTPSNENS